MTDLSSYDPDQVDIIRDAIEERLSELHTGLPAKVTKFSGSDQMVDAQPLLVRVYLDEDGEEVPVKLPVIRNIPILYPAGGGWSITWPLEVDDIVYLTFAERDIGDWLELAPGLDTEPLTARKHDINDAICVPGLRPRVSPLLNISDTDLTIGRQDGSNHIVIKADGTIEIGSAPTESAVLGDALKAYLTDFVLNVFGKHSHVSAAPGSPTGPPTPTGTAPSSSILSTSVKVK